MSEGDKLLTLAEAFLRQSDVERVSGVTVAAESTDRLREDGYRAAIADMRKALNGIDR